jgi:phosphoglycerate dehydrogenase-like enzyme
VAEWTVLKLLEIYKRSREFYRAQSERQWKKQYLLPELAGKTALIIGFGGIGREIARRLKAFGIRVVAVKRDPAAVGEPGLADSVHGIEDLDTI